MSCTEYVSPAEELRGRRQELDKGRVLGFLITLHQPRRNRVSCRTSAPLRGGARTIAARFGAIAGRLLARRPETCVGQSPVREILCSGSKSSPTGGSYHFPSLAQEGAWGSGDGRGRYDPDPRPSKSSSSPSHLRPSRSLRSLFISRVVPTTASQNNASEQGCRLRTQLAAPPHPYPQSTPARSRYPTQLPCNRASANSSSCPLPRILGAIPHLGHSYLGQVPKK